MNSFLKSLILRSALIVIVSAAAGTGFNLLYSKGIDPFRPLPPRAAASAGNGAGAADPQNNHRAPSAFTHITLEEARAKFDTSAALFVDARMDKEFEKSRIPGALHLPPNAFEKGRPEALNFIPASGVEIVLYCNGPDCPLAEETARFLIENGISHFVIFTGGWDEWAAAGFPIEEGAP